MPDTRGLLRTVHDPKVSRIQSSTQLIFLEIKTVDSFLRRAKINQQFRHHFKEI